MAFLAPPPFFAAAAPPSPSPPPSHPPPPAALHRRRRAAPAALPLPWRFRPRKALLSHVQVVNRKALPDAVVDAAFSPLADRKVTAAELAAAVDACNAWYSANGYPCARLHPLRTPGVFEHTLILLAIEPALSAFRLVPVDKEGHVIPDAPPLTTRTGTVMRALGVKEGDLFRWSADGFGKLMALSVFEYADAEVKQTSTEHVELTLRVRERKSCRIEPGAGITSDGRVYGDLSLVDNNLLGRAQRVQLEWQKRLETSRASGGLVFEDMRVGAALPLSYKLRLYRNSNASRGVPRGRIRRVMPVIAGEDLRMTRPIDGGVGGGTGGEGLRFENDRDGAMVELGFRPGTGNLLFAVAPAVERVMPAAPDRTSARPFLQTVLQTSITHVTRLPVDLPSFGHVARLESVVGRQLGAPVFRKMSVRLAKYFKVAKEATLAVGATVGVGSDNLPWHEQKSLGGPMNVRGYSYGELGRYKSYGTGRVELRVPLTKTGKDQGSNAESSEEEEEEGAVAKSKEATGVNEVSTRSTGNLVTPKMFDNLPALTGVLFGDMALSSFEERDPLGVSYGLGVRVGGVITVDWTRTTDGRKSRLHFGLVDRNL